MTTSVVFDLEADGFQPTKIHCISFCVDDEVYTMTDYNDMRRFFTSYDVYIGHFISLFDIPVIERLLDIKLSDDKIIIDTCVLSWYLYPNRSAHGLEDWGLEFGIPKPVIENWFDLPIEDYIHRCEEDVRINQRLWDKQLSYLLKLYPDKKDFWRFIRYMEFKMKTVREQHEQQWKVDLEYVTTSLEELEAEKEKRYKRLEEVMPKVPKKAKRKPPAKMFNNKGELSALGIKWRQLLAEHRMPCDYDEEFTITVGLDEPNPSSTPQIKAWLYGMGWIPRTFKYDKNPDGSTREIPQLNKPHGAGICDSIKDLYDIEPNLEELDGYYVLQHRIGVLKGFLRDQRDGYLRASVAGLTNTLRFKHAEIVNLPKVNTRYGTYCRASLIADEGMILGGSDMSSLEDRLKQHFIFPLDPDYVHEMSKDDYDPHLDIAVLGGMMTQEEADAYKAGDKAKKKIRDIAKNVNYSGQYGAGPPKMALTGGFSLQVAKALHKTYWQRNWAIKEVANEQTVITIEDQMWLLNPISGFWYSLRAQKDIFSTLVQGSANYVFEVWVGFLRQKGIKIKGQFHDEVVFQVPDGLHTYDETTKKWSGPYVDLATEAINETNEVLKLNRELGIDVQFGFRYSDIH